jgi:O-6-methylguanine DNA methyltransferase
MEIKSLTTPIGRFDSVYIDSLLTKLIFLNKMDSIHPVDKILQRLIDKFFSINELQELPKFNLQGTSFQLKVWKGLMEIPRGQTLSYGALASRIGIPGAARAVGTACKMNPIPLLIPCHRVVHQDGSIGEFALGKLNKEYLLKIESK